MRSNENAVYELMSLKHTNYVDAKLFAPILFIFIYFGNLLLILLTEVLMRM